MSDVAFIGMDLGTFKTSVACSNGRRDSFPTAVGWAKDHVARSLLGRDVVVGEEIFEHRLALDVIRPFEKGVLKYNDLEAIGGGVEETEKYKVAAKLVVQHAVSCFQLPKGTVRYGVIGAPSRASVANKQLLLEVARDFFDAVMIIPEPFAVAYEMNLLRDALIIDIGAGTVDLCPLYGAFPKEEEQFTIPAGGDYIDEEFLHRMQAKVPSIRLTQNMARQIKERHGFVGESANPVVVTIPVRGQTPQPIDVSEALQEACALVAEQIIIGIHSLFEAFDPEYHDSLLRNIVLSGGGSRLRGLDRAIEEEFKQYGSVKVSRAYDTLYAGANGALRLATGMPPEQWKEFGSITAPKTTMLGRDTVAV